MSQIHCEQLDNGLWLLGEPMDTARSVSMSLLTPAGLSRQPADQQGVCALLSEMLFRGAGDLDARQHSEALDQLGVRRSSSEETHHLRLSATLLGEKLGQALPLLLDTIRRPRLEAQALEPARMLALQTLAALDDEPQQRVMLELRRQFYPEPLGRSPYGQHEAIEQMSVEQVRAFWQAACVPGGSILAFAGRFDWDQLKAQVRELLGDWQGEAQAVEPEPDPQRGYEHLSAETSQVHIGLGYDALPEPDERSIYQKAAAAVLSGGMSGRLFTQVREKRGLCYAVSAAYRGQRDRGAVMGYAGTTTPRAQQTLEVMTDELRRLSDGVEPGEFERAIVGMKSRLVMQGESTGARASGIANDQSLRGRARTLQEQAAEVDAVTLDQLNAFLADQRPGPMTVVTLGPEPLQFAG